jgi:hypothetical protein
MVGVPSHVNVKVVGPERISFVTSRFLDHEGLVENDSFLVEKAVLFGVEKVLCKYDLVKKVPGIIISQGADAFFIISFPGVEQFASLQFFLGAF